jgi:hypothetical protein
MGIATRKKCITFLFFSIPFFSFSQNDSLSKALQAQIESMMVWKYIVIAGSSTDFKALDASAKQIQKNSDLKYENGLEYDAKRGMILPDSSEDELYAGGYVPRRYDSDEISIEMLWYYAEGHYSDREKDKRMVLLCGIFTSKTDAKQQLGLVKKTIPSAYIKKEKIYMGCMH